MRLLPDYSGFEPESDVPRKQGFPRLWEIISRDFWDCFRAGLLALLGCVPFFAGIACALTTHVLIYAPILGLIGGALAGPELCGLADTILRGLRDEPGFWWHTYRRVWRRNVKASLLPGAAAGTLLATQIFLIYHAGALQLNMGMGAALVAGILIVTGISLYVWPQLALMDLTFSQLVKNAVLLFLGQLPRSLAATAILAGYWGLVLWFFSMAVSLLPFTNFWLPTVPALFLIYPGIERNFHIEEKLHAMDPYYKKQESEDPESHD